MPMNGSSNTTANGSGGLSWPDVNIAPPDIVQTALGSVGPKVFNFLFGVPQLGVGIGDGEPGVHMPTQFPFNHPLVLGFMMFSSGTTIVLMALLIILNVIRMQLPRGTSEYEAGRLVLRSFGATLFVMLFYLPLVAAGHAFGQAMVMGAAPSAEQVTSSWGSLFQFGISAAFVGASFVELGWEFTKWMGIIHAMTWLYLVAMPAVAQPFIAIRIYRPNGKVGAMCESLLVMWPALIIAKVFSALMVNLSLSINWGASLPGIGAAFVSLALILLAAVFPVLAVLLALFSRSRMLRSSMTLGAGAMAGSTLARGARWGKEKTPNLGVREKAGHGAKKAAAKTQSKYWDAKSRAKAGVAAAGGNWKSATAERAKFKFGGDSSGEDRTASVDNGESLVSSSERVRNLEERAQRTGGATARQRKEWFHRQMEEKGVYGGSDGRARSRTQSDD